jgi:hypothetical protein
MATYPKNTSTDTIQAVHDEECAADEPLGSDVYMRMARAVNTLWEHLADDPISTSTTQTIDGHRHSRTEKDDGISEYAQRVNIQAFTGCIWPTFSGLNSGNTPQQIYSGYASGYTVNGSGSLEQQATLANYLFPMLITRDVKQITPCEFVITPGTASVDFDMNIYDGAGNLLNSDTVTYSGAGSLVTNNICTIDDVADYDDWVYVEFVATVTGAGNATIAPYYPQSNANAELLNSFFYCEGSP